MDVLGDHHVFVQEVRLGSLYCINRGRGGASPAAGGGDLIRLSPRHGYSATVQVRYCTAPCGEVRNHQLATNLQCAQSGF